MLVFALIALISTVCATTEEHSRVVRTTQGPVRGYKDPSGDFYAFYNIPYATAPVGPHKFKGPLAPPTWLDTYEAIDKKILCPQPKTILHINAELNMTYSMDDNCLIANVFVPDTEATNLPVVVYVHGGAFQLGFGNMIFHKSLIKTGKIIEVNFNYRLGGHGFLCLGTEDIPGNAGMKDQVAALRWVKKNIANFGGNPNDVTLAGYSAGAVAVELLLVSETTRGLFNKVIPESGASVGVWSVQSNPIEIALSYAREQGYVGSGDDIYALEEFFKNLSLEVLQADPFMSRRDSTFKFVPCVEREESKDAFLTDAPVNIIKNGDYEKLPLLAGFADMEGIFRLNFFELWKEDMNKKFSDFLPGDLHFSDEDEREKVAQKIKEFYFGDNEISAETVLGYVDYFSDVLFTYPTHRSLSLQAAAGSKSLYLYMYAFVDDARASPPYPGVTGAGHCDQSMTLADLLWQTNPDDTGMSDNFKKMKQLLTDVWTNFIIKGKPTTKGSLAEEIFGGEWLPTSPAESHHALFNTTSELRCALLPERMKLWDEIYSKYYFTPISPPEPPKTPKYEL